MQITLKAMGLDVHVIEDCLNGRRTVWEDPFKAGRNGLEGLAQRIEVNSPLDLVILMLDATLTRQADLALGDEQQDFVRAIRDYCDRELSTERLRELTNDYEDMHADEIARQMAELGWWSLTIDEQYVTLLLQEQQLLQDFGAEHPQVQAVRRSIDFLRARAKLSVDLTDGGPAAVADAIRAGVKFLKEERDAIKLEAAFLETLSKGEREVAREQIKDELKEVSLRGDLQRLTESSIASR